MKSSAVHHVFHVHSAITDIMAQSIIAYRGLDINVCIFVINRNFRSTFKNQYLIPFPHQPKDFFLPRIDFWNQWKRINQFDEWVLKITLGNEFEWYSLQSKPYTHSLMISHPKCNFFHFFEEGGSAYASESYWRNPKKSNVLKKLLYFLNFGNRVKVVRDLFEFDHPKYQHSFGLHDLSFKDVKGRITIPIQVKEDKSLAIYEHIIVLSPHNELHQFSLKTYITSVENTLKKLAQNGIKKVWFKFHPGQESGSVTEFKKLFTSFKGKMYVEEMPPHVFLETIAISGNPTFYTHFSSIAIYAKLAGRKVFGMNNFVFDLEPDYKSIYSNLPEILKNSIENL